MLERDKALRLSQSWTTRKRRRGESADAYRFVDRAEFEANVAAGGFLEWAQVLDDLYGTPVPEIVPGTDLILEIDVQGARQVLARRPDAVTVLVLAPSIETQIDRLRSRGEAEDYIARRVALGRRETSEGRSIARAVIVNDDLDESVEQLLAIIEEARRA